MLLLWYCSWDVCLEAQKRETKPVKMSLFRSYILKGESPMTFGVKQFHLKAIQFSEKLYYIAEKSFINA